MRHRRRMRFCALRGPYEDVLGVRVAEVVLVCGHAECFVDVESQMVDGRPREKWKSGCS
jgi:hypothetical protein